MAKRWLSFMLIAGSLFAAACGQAKDADSELAALRAENTLLRAEVAELQAANDALAAQLKERDGASEPAENNEVAERVKATARPWQSDGIADQWRMLQLSLLQDEAGVDFEAGTTDWHMHDPAALNLPAEGINNPGLLLLMVISALNAVDGLGVDVWEATLRVAPGSGGTATGIIQLWGYQDDAVAGSDWRVAMRQGEDGSWSVVDLAQRYHCARSVTADRMLCQ